MKTADWQIKKLEDLVIKGGLVRGPFGGALKKEIFKLHGYKVYEQRNAIYATTTLGEYYVDQNKYDSLKRFSVKPGDFIVSCSGTIGRIFQIPDDAPEGVINQALLKVTVDKNKILPSYFYQYFRWDKFQSQIIDNTQGGAMQNLVGMDIFRTTKLYIPEVDEQERIVRVLEVWDEHIEKLEQKIALKEQLKKGLMQQLLTGRRRLPGFNGEWRYTVLSEYAAQSKNSIVDGPFGSQMKLNEFTASGVPVIEMHHLKNGFIDTRELTRFVSNEKFNKDLKRSGVYGSDIVISKTGSLGYLGVMPEGESAVITSRLAKISLDKEKSDRDFVFQYLKFMKQVGHWERVGQGGTMKILSIDNFKKILIPKISQSEQEKIAQFLTLADDEIRALNNKRRFILTQKKYLLKNLITGTIRTSESLKPLGENI